MQPIVLPGSDPEANRAEELRLFEAARSTPAPLCLFYCNSPCVVVGRNNRLEQWVDVAACEHDAIPVLRRFSGGGAVFHNQDVLTYSFIAPRLQVDQLARQIGPTMLANKYIALFIGLLVRALGRVAPGFEPARTSDVNLNGLKVSGNAQRIASQLVLHHGTLMLRCPLSQIERYLPIPPDRPGVSHADFITGLSEQGVEASQAELREALAAEFFAVFGGPPA